MPDAPQSVIAVVLFTDLVDSTKWKGIGDREYTAHVRRPHDALFRQLLADSPGAVERDSAGDGFLATFPTPSDAVRFAVRFHCQLAAFPWADPVARTGRIPATRVGIHLGEVVEYDDPAGRKVSGQAVDLAARVMGLAGGGRTLLTRHAFDSARQHMRDEPLGWVSHGRYRFKGKEDDPLEVFEVGPDGVPLPPPADGEKAKRVVIDPADDTGAWRPAVGLPIPRREEWVLESQLGAGGFGEVWLARQRRTKDQRVFKFCFDADRLRSFKRELTFFKLIKHELGTRPDFATLLDVQVDKPPYSLESEYVSGGSLAHWIDRRGGLAGWPLADRVRFLAGVARAVAAAHSLTIIHKDLKPSNVLVKEADGKPIPVLADFGIGVLTDRTALAEGDVTDTGFTESVMLGNDSSRTGTRLYTPPEAQLGKWATTGTDVYALGVMLFQLTAGDFHLPLGVGWPERIRTGDADRDALLTEDITAATFGDPARRLGTAAEFADRLERLDARVAERKEQLARAEREREDVLERARLDRHAAEQATRLRLARRVTVAALAATVTFGGLATFAWVQRNEAESARKDEATARQAEKERADGEARAKDAERVAKDAALLDRDKQEKAYAKTAEVLDAMVSGVTGNSLATQKAITDEQKKFLTEVLTYYKEFAAGKGDDEKTRKRVARAAFGVGMIESRLGRREEGATALEKARDGYGGLAADFPAVPDYRQGLAASHTSLGVLLKDLGKLAEAEGQYRKALAIYERLAADFPAVLDYRRDLANSHNSLGNLLSGLGKRPEAEGQFRQALAIQEKLAADFPAVPDYRQGLANSHNSLGLLLAGAGKRPEAEGQYREALAIFEKLGADFPAVPDYRRDLANSHNSLGLLLAGAGKRPEAEGQYRKALAIFERLAADFPTVPEYRQGLAKSHNSLGLLLAGAGKRPEAEGQYRKALAIFEKLGADFPAVPEYRLNLGGSHGNLGALLAGGDRQPEAEGQLRQALAIFEKLAADFPAVPEYRLNLGGSYGNYGRMVREGGKPAESVEWFSKAITTLRPVHEKELRDVTTKLFLRNSHSGRAIAYHQLKEYAKALADWDHLVELCPADERPLTRARRAQARVYAGQVAEGLAEADVLARQADLPAEVRYQTACVYGVACGKIADKKKEHADRCLELLRKAVEAGYENHAHMKTDTDLDPLRDRDDFKKLLADLEKKFPPKREVLPPPRPSK